MPGGARITHPPAPILKIKNNSSVWQDIRQNQRIMKYRSLTHIYFTRSIFVSHWSIIPNTIFLHQIVFQIRSKITGSWNIGHWPTYILDEVNLCVTLINYTNYDVHPANNLEDIKQNHRPWNIGQFDLYLICGQSLSHTVSLYYLKIWHSSIK